MYVFIAYIRFRVSGEPQCLKTICFVFDVQCEDIPNLSVTFAGRPVMPREGTHIFRCARKMLILYHPTP